MLPIRTLLLLMALLPGLLLPAGTALRRCECSGTIRVVQYGFGPACAVPVAGSAGAGMARGTPSRCCAKPQPLAAERACCKTADASERAQADGDAPCRCTAAADTETPPRVLPGDTLRVPAAAPAPAPVAFELPASVVGALPQALRTRGPPAPGAQRNLPLLL